MSWTKRELINAALGKIGVAHYDFDVSPDRMQSCLQLLDAMMASWNSIGLGLNYPVPASPSDSQLDQATSIPDAANMAITNNLALELAPTFGIQPLPGVMASARKSLDELLAKYAVVPVRLYREGMPVGAGNKWRSTYRPFTNSGGTTI